MQPAGPDCSPASSFGVMPSFPAVVNAYKVLDRRDYLIPTVIPDYPAFTGIASQPGILPAITLVAPINGYSNPVTLTITNTATPQPSPTNPGNLQDTGISAITVRPGFIVQHDCATISGNGSCTLSIQYAGAASSFQEVGSLRIDFTTGEWAVISLLGLTTP